MTDNREYVVVGDGLPPEALEQIYQALQNLSYQITLMNKQLAANLATLEGAYLQHLEDCHPDG